jgi:CMP-N-acetylneuraminic acid synthetase
MNILSIIPARGGSKGIPHKNIRLLNGKPLLAYAIHNALNSSFINRVVVSTDDPEIGITAKKFGAEIMWRPNEISQDRTSSERALLHTIETLRKSEGYYSDITVFLQCTSPLTLPKDIDGTIQVLLDENADTALAVTPFHHFLWRKDKIEGSVGINHDKMIRLTRQEREPQYLETGAVYVMRTEGFIKHKHRFFGKTAVYVMPKSRVLEIDQSSDFELAELLMAQKNNQKGEPKRLSTER